MFFFCSSPTFPLKPTVVFFFFLGLDWRNTEAETFPCHLLHLTVSNVLFVSSIELSEKTLIVYLSLTQDRHSCKSVFFSTLKGTGWRERKKTISPHFIVMGLISYTSPTNSRCYFKRGPLLCSSGKLALWFKSIFPRTSIVIVGLFVFF